VCLLGLWLVLAGCASQPFTVAALHTPLSLQQSHNSTITASGATIDGLEHLNIVVTKGTMVSCDFDGDLPSSIPCRVNATTQGRSCIFAAGATAGQCSISVDLGPHTLVTYKVQGKARTGRIINLPAVTYAGGEPLVEAFCWWEWVVIVPVRECADSFSPLAPIWWQTDQPSSTVQREDRIDLGYYQDTDFVANAQVFSNMIGPLVANVFFNSQQPFAQDYTLNRDLFTLWRGPPGGDLDACNGSYSFNQATGAASAAAATDAEVLIHNETTDAGSSAGRGCAQLAHGGGSWVWVNHAVPPNNMVHESGHMLYGLGDEYCCDGGYSSISIPRNVFSTKAACDAAAAGIGVAASLCVQIANAAGDTASFWHVDDGQLDIMQSSRNVNSDWRDLGDRARVRLMRRCAAGDCF
jgi:hypothetical protein